MNTISDWSLQYQSCIHHRLTVGLKGDILFADEPTGALNSHATKDVMDIFSKIHSEGATLLLVTHDPKVALRSERIMFMNDGEIADSLHLGKYDESTAEKREIRLNQWLQDLGF